MEIVLDRKLILAENQQLETERLWLRPVTLEDAEDMFEYASDEETVAYVFPLNQELAETRKNIAAYFMNEPLGKYGIELKETNKFIGTVDLRVDEVNAIGEIGYTLNKAFWGQGYMPEATKELLRLCFEELNLMRVFAIHDEENLKSGRVMEKVGMTIEGVTPNARICKGKVVTDVTRGLTKEKWLELQVKK
ncbi:GNAT family N-acetyltransferase [Enterococcus rivorum]|uniref:GNAT family N-acetyltransferase n=1 Tax=Enterococcus rivorum TaxID=762845 RepID=A0A1E5L144_9ENTE|nr:GNAT family N-acetyltransferase [Enterococcus rivorum]MBP2098513.1 ribosomal-protein-alanine N-acetyltransferase [Enterococcus rivorum]OEH83639.1 GNAT family N-acetyltransferase [Enterococcus rivorum]